MKKLIVLSIRGYTFVASPLLHQFLGIQSGCRFEESCSRYAQRVINKYGILQGLRLSLQRLASCHPFAK